MGRKGLIVGALLLASIVGAACGDDGPEWQDVRNLTSSTTAGDVAAAEYGSPDELAAALTAAGFECTDLEPSESFSEDEESASCPFGSGDELFLVIYADAAAVREGIALGRAFICDEEFGQPGNSLSYAVGPNWTVTAPTEAEAEAIADALDAELEQIVC